MSMCAGPRPRSRALTRAPSLREAPASLPRGLTLPRPRRTAPAAFRCLSSPVPFPGTPRPPAVPSSTTAYCSFLAIRMVGMGKKDTGRLNIEKRRRGDLCRCGGPIRQSRRGRSGGCGGGHDSAQRWRRSSGIRHPIHSCSPVTQGYARWLRCRARRRLIRVVGGDPGATDAVFFGTCRGDC